MCDDPERVAAALVGSLARYGTGAVSGDGIRGYGGPACAPQGTAVLAYVVKHPGSALLHIARAVRQNMAAWRAVASVSVPALGKLLRNRVR